MDAKQNKLEEKLADLLKQAAEVASALQAEEQGEGIPHFDQIELPAHEVGRKLSKMIQASRATDVALQEAEERKCPDCGKVCRVESVQRQVHSMDGPIVMKRVVGCRRRVLGWSPASKR
jgi:hypothetical protein